MFDRLWKALDDRFTDIDECQDISNYGCEMGVDGFIYGQELKEFYFEHEDGIEELLNDHNLDYEDLLPNGRTTYSIRDCIQYSVWYAVLIYCEERVMTHQPVAV